MAQEGLHTANGTGLSFGIEQREAALGRGIEFDDLGNAKAILERLPDVFAQAVAASHADAVLRVRCRGLDVHQIAAEFADVLDLRAVPAPDIGPEAPRRKSLRNHGGAARD